MVHKITDPVRKTSKSKSIPNLLQLPSDGSDDNTVQTRSRSFSNIADKNGQYETQEKDVKTLIQTSDARGRMIRQDLKLKRPNLTDKSLYHNHIYENNISAQKDKRKKKVPPKRPPPPKFLRSPDQGSFYANLFRSTSESNSVDCIYANYEEKLDTKVNLSDDSASLYVNQCQDSRDATVDDMYIFMTDSDDFDDSGYVIMSRDRSMTS
jgi:hypothetical protein